MLFRSITNNRLGNFSSYPNPINVLPPDSIISIYRLNATSGLWESVNYRPWGWEQSIGSESFLTLDPGSGYWFEMGANTSITYMGLVVTETFNKTIIKGWNLIGTTSTQKIALPPPATEPPATPLTVAPVNSITSLWAYDSMNDAFKRTDHLATWWGWFGTDGLDTFDPATGYYAQSSQNATWEVGK